MELITEGIRLRIDMEALKGKYDKLTEKAMYFVGTILSSCRENKNLTRLPHAGLRSTCLEMGILAGLRKFGLSL